MVLDDCTAKDRSVQFCHLDKDDESGGHGRDHPGTQEIRASPRAAVSHLQASSSWIETREWWEAYKRKGNDVLDIQDAHVESR